MKISYTVIDLDDNWVTLESYTRETIRVPRPWLPSQCEVGKQVLSETKLSDSEGMVEFTVAEVSAVER